MSASEEQGLLATVQRRLARLRFDLHDGPQQDIHLLAADLQLFREQLLPSIEEDPNAGRLLGRLDDLAAQLVALDGDIRRLSTSLESPFLHRGLLPDALQEITDAFARRTGIEPQIELDGDFTKLSDSQQITLLALITEALTNVHKHGDARHVTLSIVSQAGGIDAVISDDGQGFDPQSALERSGRGNHLGLVGIHERARMLGGRAQVQSRVGGPTTVTVSLPAWPGDQPGEG